MADLYIDIREQPQEVLEAIAQSMTLRAREPAMRAIAERYMRGLRTGAHLRVLEIGCGNGASTGLVLDIVRPARLIAIDPSPGLLAMAARAFEGEPRASFHEGDALATGEPDGTFDLVMAHTVFSHLPDPQGALAEAFRVLAPGGRIAVFDGDYATNTVALFDGDPLQSAMEATRRHLIHAPYVMRRLPELATAAGFEIERVEPHGYVQTSKPHYLLSLLARGTAAAQRAGEIGSGLARALDEEAQRRVEAGCFYGSILFMSVIARKPA